MTMKLKLATPLAVLFATLLIACGGEGAAQADTRSGSGAQTAYPGDSNQKSSDGLRNTDFSKRTSTCGLYAKSVDSKSGLSAQELEAKWVGLVTKFNKHKAEANKKYGGDHEQYNTFEANRLSLEIDVLDCELDKL